MKQFSTLREKLESKEWAAYQEDVENIYYKINAQQLAKNPILLDCLVAREGRSFVQLDFCLHPKTEALTRRGWVPILQVNKQDEVWQVNKTTLVGSWVKPSRLIKREFSGNMYTYGNTRGSISVTENHRMLFIGQQTRKDRPNSEHKRWESLAQDGLPTARSVLPVASNSETFSNFPG